MTSAAATLADLQRAVAEVAPNLTVRGAEQIARAVHGGTPRTAGDVSRLVGDSRAGRALSVKEVGAIARHIAPLVLA